MPIFALRVKYNVCAVVYKPSPHSPVPIILTHWASQHAPSPKLIPHLIPYTYWLRPLAQPTLFTRKPSCCCFSINHAASPSHSTQTCSPQTHSMFPKKILLLRLSATLRRDFLSSPSSMSSRQQWTLLRLPGYHLSFIWTRISNVSSPVWHTQSSMGECHL